MAKIGNYQIKDIYTLGNALGIVDRGSHEDELHLLVTALTGKEGVSRLTREEGAQVIAELKRRMTPAGGQVLERRARAPKQHTERPGGMSAKQQKMVWAMMYQLAGLDVKRSKASLGERLCGIIKRQFGVDASPRDPMQWISFANGCQLIEILKKYIASARELQLRRDAQ